MDKLSIQLTKNTNNVYHKSRRQKGFLRLKKQNWFIALTQGKKRYTVIVACYG